MNFYIFRMRLFKIFVQSCFCRSQDFLCKKHFSELYFNKTFGTVVTLQADRLVLLKLIETYMNKNFEMNMKKWMITYRYLYVIFYLLSS